MKMDKPVGDTPLDHGGVVGQPMVRVDGRLKVTGGARYAYEFKQAPEVAIGFVVQSTIGRGRIRAIDQGAARAMPGVLLILTHENAPPQGAGAHTEAHPVLTGDRVDHWGPAGGTGGGDELRAGACGGLRAGGGLRQGARPSRDR